MSAMEYQITANSMMFGMSRRQIGARTSATTMLECDYSGREIRRWASRQGALLFCGLAHCGLMTPYDDIELGQHLLTWEQFHEKYVSHQSLKLTWKLREIEQSGVVYPHKVPVMRYNAVFVVNHSKLLSKQSHCWWLETLWHSCDITEVIMDVHDNDCIVGSPIVSKP